MSLHTFETLFDYVISWLYMHVLKLTLGKIIIYANFPLFSTFQCEASKRTWLRVRMHAVLSLASLASGPSGCIVNTSGQDPYRFLSISLLSLPYAHLCIFLDLSCHFVCGFLAVFSWDFSILYTSLLIPWYLMCLPLFF
jgi:hypothetical protein